jgi:hypothetical protein
MTDTKFLRRFTDGKTPPVCPEILEIDSVLTNTPYITLPIPKIEPDNWDLFWELWNKEKSLMGETAVWESVGIWSSSENKVNENFPYKVSDWSEYFPNMFEHIRSAMPFQRIDNIRLSMNIKRVHPHMDPYPTIYPWPNSLRIMLWDSNEDPTFYLLPWPEESYNQPPIPKIDVIPKQTYILGDIPQEDKIYVNLPNDTNTFVMSNGEFLHGADLSKPKIILIVVGIPDVEKWKNLLYKIVR